MVYWVIYHTRQLGLSLSATRGEPALCYELLHSGFTLVHPMACGYIWLPLGFLELPPISACTCILFNLLGLWPAYYFKRCVTAVPTFPWVSTINLESVWLFCFERQRVLSCGRVGSSHACDPAFGQGAEYRRSRFSRAV